jgi:hypothetical protein
VVEPVTEPPAGQQAQQHRQVVHGLDPGVGIVDRWGQCLVADVNQAPQAERDILDHGPLEPDAHRITERRLQQLWVESCPVGGPRPRPGQGRGLDNVVADLPGQPHNQILACRRPDQGVGLDGLNVAGVAGRHDHGRRRRVGTLLLPLQVPGRVGVEVVDDPPGLTLDRTHDRVDLDRVG